MEEDTAKLKREYDKFMNHPKDDDTEKDLGSILGVENGKDDDGYK